jgi:hypothetical protein
MTDELDIQKTQSNFRTKALIIGPILGAAVGVVGAYLFIQGMEKRNAELKISPREGVALTLIVMALLRQIAELPDKNK